MPLTYYITSLETGGIFPAMKAAANSDCMPKFLNSATSLFMPMK